MSTGRNDRSAQGAVSALILAAGSGVRMAERPKAFLKTGGKTLIERAVVQVQPFATEVVVGVREKDLDRATRLLGGLPAVVLAGGATRQGTFERLLDRATHPLVLVHEVARPLAPPELFAAVLAAAAAYGAATPYLLASSRDAIAMMEGEYLGPPLPRDRVVKTQTPQAYRRQVLSQVCRLAQENGWDEASIPELFIRAGHNVRLVAGAPENVKITFPKDWKRVRSKLMH